MSELKTIGKHAGSVLAGQLAVMAFGVADTVIAGQYSDQALAALSVGSALFISVYVGLIGIVQALLPIWAELLGGSRFEALGHSLRQSLYLCGFIITAGVAALLFPGALLEWAQVPIAMQGEVQHYLAILALAFAPALLFRLYSTFNQSLGKPLLVTCLQIASLGVKIPLSIWFVGGGGGLAPMGAAGCAWATLIVNYALFSFAVLLLLTHPLYRPFRIWRAMEAPDWQQIAGFARLGLPAGMAYFVEVTSFTLMALFIARLGVAASAAHQVAASMAAVLYMVPLSLAIACSARVSFWLGAGEPKRARKVVWLALMIGGACALALAATVLAGRDQIAGLYSESPAVRATASALLLWVALYHVADSTQAISAFLLRCYRITILPLVLYCVFLWGLGLWGGYRLTYDDSALHAAMRSPSGFWIASIAAIALVALLLLALLVRTVRRPHL